MVTNIIMVLILILFATQALCTTKRKKESNNVFELDEGIVYKGLWAFVIMMVHVPNGYTNTIQNIIGSFAYIGVTYFFMSSSYGLLYGVNNKKDYLKLFWKKHIPKLLLPCFMANIINVIIMALAKEEVSFWTFVSINKYVLVLLLFYILFYIINLIVKNKKMCYIFLIITTVLISIITYTTKIKLAYIWPIEVMGFLYGVLLYAFRERILDIINKKQFFMIVSSFVASAILGIIYIKFKGVSQLSDYMIKICLSFFFMVLNIVILNSFSIKNKINMYLGKISFEIYLIHIIIFDRLHEILYINNSAIYIVTSMTLSFILSMFINLLCTKILSKGKGKSKNEKRQTN